MYISASSNSFNTTLESTVVTSVTHVGDLKIVHTTFRFEIDSVEDKIIAKLRNRFKTITSNWLKYQFRGWQQSMWKFISFNNSIIASHEYITLPHAIIGSSIVNNKNHIWHEQKHIFPFSPIGNVQQLSCHWLAFFRSSLTVQWSIKEETDKLKAVIRIQWTTTTRRQTFNRTVKATVLLVHW